MTTLTEKHTEPRLNSDREHFLLIFNEAFSPLKICLDSGV